jgi:hypothetical protein
MNTTNAPRALESGNVPPKRVLFGLFDASGWGWAGVRAILWTLVIIMMLGYIPDRAYYLTVSPTVELGLNGLSLVNICPAENEGLPCPAPNGALLPWKSGTATDLPGGGVGGGLVQAGAHLYYIGGGVGTTETAVAEVGPDGLSSWSAGAPLPAPRTDIAAVFFAGKAYVVGGSNLSAKATTNVYVGIPDVTTGLITSWEPTANLELPSARAGVALVVVSDGIILIGGRDAAGMAQTNVWKAKLQSNGELAAWTPMMELPVARTNAAAALIGDALYVWGGSETDGTRATGITLRGDLAVAQSPSTGHSTPAATPDPAQGETPIGEVYRWTAESTLLPVPRIGAALWSANGTLYVAGGATADGSAVTSTYWIAPTAAGLTGEWATIAQDDLPVDNARIGAHGIVLGGNAVIIGGVNVSSLATANSTLIAGTSPKAPVFRLGLFGLTVPGLAIEGEVGQQLGYLSAAGAWTLNFVLLLAAAVVYAQRERATAWLRAKLGRKDPSSY